MAVNEADLVLFKLAEQHFALLVEDDIEPEVQFVDRDLAHRSVLRIKAPLIEIGEVKNRLAQRFGRDRARV